MLLCLYNILPPFSVYVKSATSSSWGYPFLLGPSKLLHSTNAVLMLGQHRRRWPIIEKLTAPPSCLLGTWPAAKVIGEVSVTKFCCIRGGAVQVNSDQFNYK